MPAPPQNLSPPKEWKLDAIDFAISERGAKSFADLGGIGVVYGQYSMHAMDNPAVEKVVLVDDFLPGLEHEWVADETSSRGIDVVHGNFADPRLTERVGDVDAILLFEVLLHAADPDWDDLISMWAPHTKTFVVANPQWTGPETVRLIELGRERYLGVVPDTSNHRALFDRLDVEVPHLGKPWRNAHHVFQWGITDEGLTAKMREEGFELASSAECGAFLGNSPNFTNKWFVFGRS